MSDGQTMTGTDLRVDPRFQRSHDSLAAVMLRLAAERPAEQISVHELAREAGVSRQTFYRHSPSPVDFLAELLVAELAPLDEDLIVAAQDPDVRFSDAWRAFYLAALDQVASRETTYRVIVGERSAVFDALLSFFESSATHFIRAVSVNPPDDVWIKLASQQQAGNIAAIIRTWVLTGMTMDPEDLVDRFMSLAPPWQLAHRGPSGTVDLQDVRAGRRS